MSLGQWIRVGGLYHSERDKDGLPFLHVTNSSGSQWTTDTKPFFSYRPIPTNNADKCNFHIHQYAVKIHRYDTDT